MIEGILGIPIWMVVSNMDMLYGKFDEEQFKKFQEKLHKELFWLLLYKDPKTTKEYAHVDFEKYLIGLQRKINGLNELLFYPPQIISIMSLLQAALQETRKEDFDYSVYRKLVLDAHALVDKIGAR